MAINYAITGLALDSPTSVFWPLSNRARFASVWNPLVIEYWFVGPASRSQPLSIAAFLQPNFGWWAELLRLPHLRGCLEIALVTAVFGTVTAVIASPRDFAAWTLSRSRPFAGLFAFVAGAVAVAQLFQGSESIYRLYAFCLAFAVLALGLAVGILCRPGVGAPGTLRQWLIVLWCLASVLVLMGKVPRDWRHSAFEFAAGRIPLQQAIRASESAFHGRITAQTIAEFRSATGIESRIMFLTYDPAPAYYLPSPAVVSEPSYAFGKEYGDLLYGGDERAREILMKRGVGVLAMNLQNRLFLGLPYSPLLSPAAISKNFSLAWRKGDIVFLRWREPGNTAPVPAELVRMVEAKRTGIIPADAGKRWGNDLAEALSRGRRTDDQGSTYYDWLYDAMNPRRRDAQSR